MKVNYWWITGLMASLCACVPQSTLPTTASSKYSIDSYKEASQLNTNLTGVWMAIHSGKLTETTDGVDYTVTGNIRELIEITESSGNFYARTCLDPSIKNVISISGNNVSVQLNDELATLTKTSFTAMVGTAAHSSAASTYSGTLNMKKIAALNTVFGTYPFLNTSLAKQTLSANCLEEASLYVVGKKSLFSKWANLEVGNVVDWNSATYHQTGYMYSTDGTADAVKELRFSEGVIGGSKTLREYPSNGEAIAISVASSNASIYQSNISATNIISGAVDIDFSSVVILANTQQNTSGGSTSLPASTGSSGQTMLDWIGGLLKIKLPW